MLTPEFRKGLVAMIKKHKGTVPLTMLLIDPEKGWKIEFLSRKFQVAVNNQFIEELKAMKIPYNVVRK